ncbi:hypothetical protein D0T84_00790 [Dysgonomonas sp. 521]|uniref:hypothetical protein n=1 Tax=Dysgonomonas sp. 521 TaxID=2302932 RepID=UPI0013D18541|nr:hypothetical protein [Dysgonomonas sp. 521]NDV93454.1 hypothetical protein [Dysgonomonas sp. 521]
MKEKIFNALKTAILVGGKTSVSDATINTYVGLIDVEKITDENQIAEAIKPFVPVLQAVQANINSVAASSVTAKESELNKTIEELKKSIPEPTKNPDVEVPEWQKAIEGLTATVQTLASTVGAQQAEKTHETLSQKLTSLLTEKKVPEWYSSDILDGRTFKDENDVNTWAEKISTKWGERNQELTNNGFRETVPPGSGNDDVKDSEIIAAAINAGTRKIVEQQNQN